MLEFQFGKEGRNEGRRKEGRPTIDTQLTSLNNTWRVLFTLNTCSFDLKGDLPNCTFKVGQLNMATT